MNLHSKHFCCSTSVKKLGVLSEENAVQQLRRRRGSQVGQLLASF
jgi:hypothetical protein